MTRGSPVSSPSSRTSHELDTGGGGVKKRAWDAARRFLASPRLIEVAAVLYAKERAGSGASMKDVMYWLGVNDKKASILVSRLKELGFAYEDSGRIYLTEWGKDLCRRALRILGFYDVNILSLDQVLRTIRERHVYYRARTVNVSPHRVFDVSIDPTPKVKLFMELWRRLTTFQRISAAVFMAMDFERVEDQIKDLRRRALQAELSGIHRYVRLFSLALPPNLLGQEIPLKELAESIGYRWRFAEVLRDRVSLSRYVAQVDALRLARYVPENDALSPLHETGLKAFRWLAERVDTAFRNIVDFYQPIAVSLYAIIYNNLITYDELVEGTRPRELEEVREAVGNSTYREVIAKVFSNRLERYRLVYAIGRDRYLIPLSVFHRAMIWRGTDLDSIVRSVKTFLESAPESTKPILELVVRRVSIRPEDLVRELDLSEESARAVLEQLSEHGLVIPARQRYLWIGVAPAKLIEEAMGRDVFIILYDVTKRYCDRLARYGVDLIEILEDLAAGRMLDVASYVSSRRELIELDHYLFRLALMGLVKFENGYVTIASADAAKILKLFTTSIRLPYALDTIGRKILDESALIRDAKKLRDKLVETVIEEKMIE